MHTGPRITTRQALAAALLAVPIAIAIHVVADRGWVAAPLVGLLLLALYLADRGSRAPRFALMVLAVAVIGAYGFGVLTATVNDVVAPPEWDFRAFWILARVATLHLNFYEPEHGRLLAAAFQNTPDFLPELVFLYPPPTMFLFAPLGLFDINTASLLWEVLQLAILVLDCWLLWRLFLHDSGLAGLLVSAALILALRSTLETVEFAQTDFLMLLLVLLLWRDRAVPRAGVWLALGVLVKPIVAVLGIFFLVRRRWSAIGVAFATGTALVVLSAVAFGVDTLRTYLVANPNGNAPPWVYTETLNQSLLATILRTLPGGSAAVHPLLNPVFLIVAAGIVGVTSFLCAQREAVSDELALSLLIPTALMVYPSSSTHYAELMVVPVMYLVSRRQFVPGGSLVVVGVAVVVYASAGGLLSFFGVLIAWLALAGLAADSIIKQGRLRRQNLDGRLSPTEFDQQRAAVLARF